MDKFFLTILNMSLTGAFVIAAICVMRLPLKKAPKIISYCLWAVAGFRLVFPVSIESIFSLIPFHAQTIPTDIALEAAPRIDSGIPIINSAVSSVLPAATESASVNPLQIWISVATLIWAFGLAAMLIYGVVSYLILKRNMTQAVCVEANIYETENIKSPFVLGVLMPRIYLPSTLSPRERSYIILHEQTHIQRHDHIVKCVAYVILCLHWFNPLAWAAFLLVGVDMELSCDERVLTELGEGIKKEYSLSLLTLATQRRFIGGSPLAFGEGGIKERIKNILNFKRPSRVIVVTAAAAVALLAVGLICNKAVDENLPVQGARYVLGSGTVAGDSGFVPREWIDFYFDEAMPWTSTYEFMLDEFPGVMFRWTAYKVTALSQAGEKELFSGMPIWNVYLADLNGDGLPELCATVSIGSGIIDTRIVVYDYANDNSYELSDRATYDYALSLIDGQLMATQTEYSGGEVYAVGALSIVDGELVASGIDRTETA